jgi:hypothetical protein
MRSCCSSAIATRRSPRKRAPATTRASAEARTIAERKRRRNSGALESVRASLERPRTRRSRSGGTRTTPPSPAPAQTTITSATLAALSAALHTEGDEHWPSVRTAVEQLAAEGRAAGVPVEVLVTALKSATSSSNGIDASELSSRYGAALIQLLALYFEENAE